MRDLAVAFGLVLVIEGILWAAFPHQATKLLEIAAEAPEGRLRFAGALAAAVGVGLVWFVRG
jgi:hypothetical protein